MDAHLGQFRSELTMVPLTYVIRDCNLPVSGASAKSDEEKEVARCPHFSHAKPPRGDLEGHEQQGPHPGPLVCGG
jgi:hypothetical protein